jgi:NADH dehydrogenase
VVIVGSGFAGLAAAKALHRADVEVTVVDRTNHHLFQPLLYQVATGILSEGDIAVPIRAVLRKQDNARVLIGEVIAVDVEARRLTVDAFGLRSEVGYDSLIVAAGAGQSYFGNEEFAEHAPGMKTLDDALELRGRIFGAFEMAEREENPDLRRAWLTFVVVGGGATGVEMAGQIVELSRRSLRRNFRSIDPSTARVVILDAAPSLLTSFPKTLQQRTASTLEKLGVELHFNTMVTGIDATGVDTNATKPALRRIDAVTKVWAAGVEASPLGRTLGEATGAAVDRAGRVAVEPDLTLPGHEEIFVVGDLMSLDQLPGVATVAKQAGRHAGKSIRRRVRGKDGAGHFRYRDPGSLATISRFRAIAVIGRLRFAGFAGWLLWLVVHLMYLTGFKNRIAVLFNWTIAFIGRGRPERAITAQQVFARRALQHHEATVPDQLSNAPPTEPARRSTGSSRARPN